MVKHASNIGTQPEGLTTGSWPQQWLSRMESRLSWSVTQRRALYCPPFLKAPNHICLFIYLLAHSPEPICGILLGTQEEWSRGRETESYGIELFYSGSGSALCLSLGRPGSLALILSQEKGSGLIKDCKVLLQVWNYPGGIQGWFVYWGC